MIIIRRHASVRNDFRSAIILVVVVYRFTIYGLVRSNSTQDGRIIQVISVQFCAISVLVLVAHHVPSIVLVSNPIIPIRCLSNAKANVGEGSQGGNTTTNVRLIISGLRVPRVVVLQAA